VDFRKIKQKDRSGVSTILVIVIVLAMVVAAGAAYVVLFAEEKETREPAPGTMMVYERSVEGESYGTLELYIVGQNKDEYFAMAKQVIGESITTAYELSSKRTALKIIGTEDRETIDGTMKLTVCEYSFDVSGTKVQVKAYIDMSNGLVYEEEITAGGATEVRVLKDYDLKWQDSYKESSQIGKTYKYILKYSGYEISVELKCVADCENDQYGMVYDFIYSIYPDLYFVCDGPEGLPADAEYVGTNTLTDTIDGDVATQMFELTDVYGGKWTFYYEPDSKMVYEIIINHSGVVLTIKLTEKPG
jgi:hypothetical protein